MVLHTGKTTPRKMLSSQAKVEEFHFTTCERGPDDDVNHFKDVRSWGKRHNKNLETPFVSWPHSGVSNKRLCGTSDRPSTCGPSVVSMQSCWACWRETRWRTGLQWRVGAPKLFVWSSFLRKQRVLTRFNKGARTLNSLPMSAQRKRTGGRCFLVLPAFLYRQTISTSRETQLTVQMG